MSVEPNVVKTDQDVVQRYPEGYNRNSTIGGLYSQRSLENKTFLSLHEEPPWTLDDGSL